MATQYARISVTSEDVLEAVSDLLPTTYVHYGRDPFGADAVAFAAEVEQIVSELRVAKAENEQRREKFRNSSKAVS
jgi:hypothetical protein